MIKRTNDLHGRQAVLLVDLPADAGAEIVEGGQAVKFSTIIYT